MIVSGLPDPVAEHAGNIALFALELLSLTSTYKKLDNPDENIRIQTGIHSGSVVAGVLGISTARYCIFGNTVSIASCMEATALPGKIQISSECNAELEELGGFHTIERGFIQVPGNNKILHTHTKICFMVYMIYI